MFTHPANTERVNVTTSVWIADYTRTNKRKVCFRMMWCDMVAEFSVTSPDRSYNRVIDNLSPRVLYVLLWFKCDIWVKAPPALEDVSAGITLHTLWMPCSIDLTCYFHSQKCYQYFSPGCASLKSCVGLVLICKNKASYQARQQE